MGTLSGKFFYKKIQKLKNTLTDENQTLPRDIRIGERVEGSGGALKIVPRCQDRYVIWEYFLPKIQMILKIRS